MAGPRSPSPVLTRPTTNPNLRASETNSSIRRSFTGNPFAKPSLLTNPRSFVPNTPANSPADFGRKLHVGKEGSSRNFEEKENEKGLNLKAMKCKSPSKASKNFMSPTISAASKFTPSPRKRILGERNEPIRTSISFSDGKESSVEDFDTKPERSFNQNTVEGLSDLAGFDKKEVFEAPSDPKASKRVTFSDEVLPISHYESDCDNSESRPHNKLFSSSMSPIIAQSEVLSILKGDTYTGIPINSNKQPDYVSEHKMQSDSVIVDSSLDLGPFYSPVIAPLDADPSFPPYDPKTNYLSPRPQFLRYKPNRRVEVLLNKGLNFEGQELDDSFVIMSDNSQDTDVTEDNQSGESQKDSEDGSSTEALPSEEQEALMLSEPTPAGTPISTQMLKQIFETQSGDSQEEFEDGFSTETMLSEEEELLMLSEPRQIFEAKRAPKPGFFTRSKYIYLLFVLLIACVSVSVIDVSITGSPVIKDSSFYKLYESSEVAAFARKKIDGLAGDFLHWYESSEVDVFAREIFEGSFRNFQQWYESSEIAIYANKYFDGFARSFKQCSSQTISFISKLVPHLGEVDKSVSIQFCNLTDLQEHSFKDGYFEVNHQEKIAEIYDDYELEAVAKGEADMEHLDEKAYSTNVVELSEEESEVRDSSEIDEVLKTIQAEMNYSESSEVVLDQEQTDTESQSFLEKAHSTDVVNEHIEEESEVQYSSEIDEVQNMIQAEMNSQSPEEVLDLEQIDKELQSNIESDSPASKAKPEVEAPEVITYMEFVDETKSSIPDRKSESKPEVVSHTEFHINNDAIADKTIYNVAEAPADMAISEVVDSPPPTYKPSARTILGISILVLSVVAASAFTYLKQGKNTTAVNHVVHVEPKQAKNMISSPTPFEHIYQDRPFSRNSPTNSDMSGELCPSEMSSFQKTSSYSKGSLRGVNKAQSQERKPRANTKRESLASSSEFSTGSPSYGSFTTFERIPLKYASGDEETVTPVRRSSRIRSKFTSP